jgi:CheY-like chemotaxis protein
MIVAMPGGVLVVDDDAGFRGVARVALAGAGLVVAGEADSVASAVAAARSLRPDGVLVDIGLPDGDGGALAMRLSALPWHPRIVLTSTDPAATGHDELDGVGAEKFVAKEDLASAAWMELFGR